MAYLRNWKNTVRMLLNNKEDWYKVIDQADHEQSRIQTIVRTLDHILAIIASP